MGKVALKESATSSEEKLPTKEEITLLFSQVAAFSGNSHFSRILAFFQQLRVAPPQVLLLEGGTTIERLIAAHYWALLLNCSTHLPCLSCQTCIRMITHLHRDFFFLDGTAGSIKIDDVRAIKRVLGEPPREAFRRIILLREAQGMAAPAANALLKSLEEPQPATSFIMLAPQRERLLPTLVSRSMVLTLPWPHDEERTDESVYWETALCNFIITGRGWFQLTATKQTIDATGIHCIINLIRRAMVTTFAEVDGQIIPDSLAQKLSALSHQRLRFLDEVLAEAQDSAIVGVNPAVVADWLATRLFLLIPR